MVMATVGDVNCLRWHIRLKLWSKAIDNENIDI